MKLKLQAALAGAKAARPALHPFWPAHQGVAVE